MTAACDGSDTDIWFEGTPSYNKELAVSICRGCPMREACLLTHRTEPFGIFGGLTPSQRARFGKVRKPPPPAPNRHTITPGDGDARHGTVNGYDNLSCRCQECRCAVATARAQRRAGAS